MGEPSKGASSPRGAAGLKASPRPCAHAPTRWLSSSSRNHVHLLVWGARMVARIWLSRCWRSWHPGTPRAVCMAAPPSVTSSVSRGAPGCQPPSLRLEVTAGTEGRKGWMSFGRHPRPWCIRLSVESARPFYRAVSRLSIRRNRPRPQRTRGTSAA